MIIKNGRIIDPANNIDFIGNLYIKNGKIEKIISQGEGINNIDNQDEIIDASGMIVSPGLIDCHVHFRDPGFTYKEDLETGSNAAAKGGFTTVICMANTKPKVDNLDTLNYLKEKSYKLPINLLFSAAITKDFKGKVLVDMKELFANGVVGFTDDGIPLEDAAVVREAMKIAKELEVPLSFHEEDPRFVDSFGVNKGKISEKLGVGGASSKAEEVLVERDLKLALETGAKINLQHLSSKGSVELLRTARLLEKENFIKEGLTKDVGEDKYLDTFQSNLHGEATPQHFTLTEEILLEKGTLAKVNPPIRTAEDREAIIKGLQDETIDLIVTDHAPHADYEKTDDFIKSPSGMIGLETSLALGITSLVDKGYLSLSQLLEKMTVNPARLYKLQSGTLSVGSGADITIFNPNEKWIVTENFASKSKNSPFIGMELKGKVKYTIVGGKIVYRDN
ncbi:MAG: dihydroorotase [Lachnospiraceae bacterium]|jgi:dihydroorotase|nr:dihydroorotase [Lachnospiraceae bacterium]